MASSGDIVQGFRGLTVKLDERSSVLRWIFVKQHSVRDQLPEKPSDRTIFVINIPPFCDEECLKRMFEVSGDITSVFIHQAPSAALPEEETSSFFLKCVKVKGYRVAYIVYDSPDGVYATLKLDPKNPLILHPPKSYLCCGLDKWRREYNQTVVDPSSLQEEINQFMAEFDEKSEKKKMAEKNAMETDNEGWITVTRGGRRPGIRRTESVKKKIMGRERVKRKKKELRNFYTFQIRESKMKHLEALRKKFQEDKERLIALKQTRRFKPF